MIPQPSVKAMVVTKSTTICFSPAVDMVNVHEFQAILAAAGASAAIMSNDLLLQFAAGLLLASTFLFGAFSTSLIIRARQSPAPIHAFSGSDLISMILTVLLQAIIARRPAFGGRLISAVAALAGLKASLPNLPHTQSIVFQTRMAHA